MRHASSQHVAIGATPSPVCTRPAARSAMNAARSAAGSISALGLRRCHQRLLAGCPRLAGIRSALAVRDQVAQAGDVCSPAVAAALVALVRGATPPWRSEERTVGKEG